MNCFICKNEISDENIIKCPRCGAPVNWGKTGGYIFAINQLDKKRFREVQIKYINHRDEQERIKEQKNIDKEKQKAEIKKQEALKRSEQERIRKQNRIAEEERIKDEKKAAEAKKTEQEHLKEQTRIDREQHITEEKRKSEQERLRESNQINERIKKMGIVSVCAFLISVFGTILVDAIDSYALTEIIGALVGIAGIILIIGVIYLMYLFYKKKKTKNL